jgi:hypothetical protein
VAQAFGLCRDAEKRAHGRVLMASTEQAKGLLHKVFPGVVEIDELQS